METQTPDVFPVLDIVARTVIALAWGYVIYLAWKKLRAARRRRREYYRAIRYYYQRWSPPWE